MRNCGVSFADGFINPSTAVRLDLGIGTQKAKLPLAGASTIITLTFLVTWGDLAAATCHFLITHS